MLSKHLLGKNVEPVTSDINLQKKNPVTGLPAMCDLSVLRHLHYWLRNSYVHSMEGVG